MKRKHAGVTAEGPNKAGRTNKETDGDDAPWTCDVCQITIRIKPIGPSAKDQHLAGKKHKKKEKAAAAAGATTDASGPTAAASSKAAPGPDMSKWWDCEICGFSLASSAKEGHLSGKKHLYLARKHQEFKENQRDGDWLCSCGQHNYASKVRCIRSKCRLAKEAGSVQQVRKQKMEEAKAAMVKDPSNELKRTRFRKLKKLARALDMKKKESAEEDAEGEGMKGEDGEDKEEAEEASGLKKQ